ncbi:MAG: hypothetical protein EB127_13250 [Alphaproteobacteria bacterium]|nr:hypothetical protein [Alphaproteobacteria bacterium]
MIDWSDINKVQVAMSTVLVIVIGFLLLLLWIWHRNSESNIDLKDLICSKGKIDEKKFVRFGAWIVSTWGFVYLIIEERFSEWYFMGYMAAWVGNAILDKYLNKPKEDDYNDRVETGTKAIIPKRTRSQDKG